MKHCTSPERRSFLTQALQAGAGAVIAGTAGPPLLYARTVDSSAEALLSLPDMPSRAFVQHEGTALVPMERAGNRFTSRRASVALEASSTGTAVEVSCPQAPISRVVLRWQTRFPEDTLFLGDAWERSYGDLQWRFLQPERVMPWYFAAHQERTGRSFLLGVKTQPAAMCFWIVDGEGISLWLDLRNGGSPSIPGDRSLTAATIVSLAANQGEAPFAALGRFCHALCPDPRKLAAPVAGNNNWYYAYGENFDANAMRRDAEFLAELAGSHANRPFCVVDAGWSPGGTAPGGPWTHGLPKTFPDMPGLAADMQRLRVRPGIWMRPTALSVVDDVRRLLPVPTTGAEKPLDPTLPENLQLIHDDVARVCSWGYQLIKHDFSSYDLFGRWGSRMGAEITESGWHFHDQTLTNAEIVLRLYRTLRKAAGNAILLGCNTFGHLGAGLFDVQRTGDDNSGQVWERTRRMGINTLAFRLAQNGAFFSCDPDCAPHTARTPWPLDREFLDLVARSGTALFVSANPVTTTPEQKQALGVAMRMALSGGAGDGCEPLDWLHNTTPERWRFGKDEVNYHWAEPSGTNPMPV